MLFIITSFNNMSFHVVRRKLYVLGPGPRCRKTYYLLLKTYNLKIFRCLYRRCPPLPIPNREVKPARADGTAVTCGRVGRCQILKGPITKVVGPLFLPPFFLTERPCAWPGQQKDRGTGNCLGHLCDGSWSTATILLGPISCALNLRFIRFIG